MSYHLSAPHSVSCFKIQWDAFHSNAAYFFWQENIEKQQLTPLECSSQVKNCSSGLRLLLHGISWYNDKKIVILISFLL